MSTYSPKELLFTITNPHHSSPLSLSLSPLFTLPLITLLPLHSPPHHSPPSSHTHTLHAQLRMYQQISELQLRPLNVVMKRILDRLGRKDPANIFAKPVSLEEVCIVSFPHHRKLGMRHNEDIFIPSIVVPM